MAEQHADWIEGRRYLGLDILAKSRLALITDITEEANTDTDLKALSVGIEAAEIYDPAAGGFAAAGQMVSVRAGGQAAVRLLDGRVLLAGGWGRPQSPPAPRSTIRRAVSSSRLGR